jgi:hypothetical protein
VSEFVPDILQQESTEAGHVRQRRFYDFAVFSESKRIQKLRYMRAGPPVRASLFSTPRNPERLRQSP